MSAHLKAKAHLTALKDSIELLTVAFLLGLGADVIWVYYEMYCSGITVVRGIIAVGLTASFIIVVAATVKLHNRHVREWLHKELAVRLKSLKRRHCRAKR